MKMSKGQSLFEVVLALGLAALIMVALVTLVASSIRNTTFARKKTVATRHAQEATEWLRGQRDEGWDAFMLAPDTSTGILYCPDSLQLHRRCLEARPFSWTNCGPCDEDTELIDDVYRREIIFECKRVDDAAPEGTFRECTATDVNAVDATVEVSWEDAQGQHMIESATSFSDWRSRPTPVP